MESGRHEARVPRTPLSRARPPSFGVLSLKRAHLYCRSLPVAFSARSLLSNRTRAASFVATFFESAMQQVTTWTGRGWRVTRWYWEGRCPFVQQHPAVSSNGGCRGGPSTTVMIPAARAASNASPNTFPRGTPTGIPHRLEIGSLFGQALAI